MERLATETRALFAALRAIGARAAVRVAARAGAVAVAAALFLALFFFSGVGGWTALLAFAGMAATITALPPHDEPDEAAAAALRKEGNGGGRDGDGWRAVVDAIPEPAVVLDAAGIILHHNELVRDLYPNVRNGSPLSYTARNPALNGAIDKASGGEERVVVEFFERVPVERRISATVSSLGARRPGRLPNLLVTFRDQTEQDRLAQMRADFIANASHELRTPLASLKGFVETLQGPARDDPASRDRFLGIMASQAARMTRLIDDLLSLSRVEMRVHLPPRGLVDLNEAAGYVAQSLEPVAKAAGASLRVKKSDEPARIRGDRDEIVQVLQNLVHNAIKYGREGGTVEIAVARVMDGVPPTSRVLLAVADDGPGIEAEHLPRLTERFYRANVAASREKGGTGLGLAIVKHIVVRHRGELRIASEVGRGSTFSVLFDELGTRTPGA